MGIPGTLLLERYRVVRPIAFGASSVVYLAFDEFGGPFAVICPVMKPALRITRGEISYFMSSDVGRRGFCSDCGTPLTFDYPDGDDVGVLVRNYFGDAVHSLPCTSPRKPWIARSRR